MRRAPLLIGWFLALFLALSPAAYAKGPSGASIVGDGVDGVLSVDEAGELGQGTAMSRFVEAVGFFDLVFGDSPDVVQSPAVKTGEASLVITWDMGDGSTIVQELFLDGVDGPLPDPMTHVVPGQEFWDNWRTEGGWLTVTADIAGPLVELGVDAAVLGHRAATDEPAGATPAVPERTPPEKGSDIGTEPGTVQPAAVAAAATGAAGAEIPREPTGPALPPGAVATLLVGGIIGAGTWMRRRRLAPR